MTEIFYYSGTGFTLKAAKLLKEKINGDVKLSPIISAIRKKDFSSNANRVGLLMPMHAFGIPIPFLNFLKNADFKNAEYIFSLVTRGGAPTRMHIEIDKILKKNGKKLNLFHYVTTPNTFDIIFPVHTTAEMAKEREEFNETVTNIADLVNDDKEIINKGYRNRFFEWTLFPLLKILNRKTGYFNLQSSFYSDSKCTGCGICEEMCLSEKIKLRQNKPNWNKNIQCQFCLSCLHLCPSKSVQVANSKTPELGRIYCNDIDYKDIANQKKV